MIMMMIQLLLLLLSSASMMWLIEGTAVASPNGTVIDMNNPYNKIKITPGETKLCTTSIHACLITIIIIICYHSLV